MNDVKTYWLRTQAYYVNEPIKTSRVKNSELREIRLAEIDLSHNQTVKHLSRIRSVACRHFLNQRTAVRQRG